MNKGTITTLDFVISVLREHEKEMSTLCDKLDEVLEGTGNKGIHEDIGEVRVAVNNLKMEISNLDQKISGSGDKSVENLLTRLSEQVALLTKSLTMAVETLQNYPSKKEIENIKRF